MNREVQIRLTHNGQEGRATLGWIVNQWSRPHYEAFIEVPYQDAKWTNIGIYDKADRGRAFVRAEEELKGALERCTLC